MSALVLVALLASQPDPVRVRVLAGGTVGLMTGGEAKVEPLARVAVGWDVWRGDRPIAANVVADFIATPGDAVNLADPASFRALEFSLGISWRVVPSVAASAYCEAGFSSRLETRGNEPRDEAPKWGACGARFAAETRHAYLQVGFGGDQRLDGRYVPAVTVSGALDLYESDDGRLEGTSLSLVVRAVLGLDHSINAPQRRDIVTAGVAFGWGQ